MSLKNICSKCGKIIYYKSNDYKESNSSLIHNIIEVTDDISEALDFSNLITLCNSCYEKVHSKHKLNK